MPINSSTVIPADWLKPGAVVPVTAETVTTLLSALASAQPPAVGEVQRWIELCESTSLPPEQAVRVQPLSDDEITNALVSVGLDLGRCNERDIECARAIERAFCANNGLQINETEGE